MTNDTALGPGAEFDAIRLLLARWGRQARGIGDDAALLDIPRGERVVLSIDASVEGRHFRRGWLSAQEIGYRSVSAALSDLAAMAARPIGILTAITLPESWLGDLEPIGDGIGEAASAVGAPIIGGNMSGGDELSITTTVIGSAFDPLERSGARAAELVYVTGRLGASGAAVNALRDGGVPLPEHRAQLVHPVPRIAEARWLLDHGATAAIDVSDGLLSDLRHLAAASAVRIEIDGDRVPCVANVSLDDALRSGEEYELVVTSRQSFDVRAFEARFGLPLTEIGVVLLEPAAGVDVRGAAARVANDAGWDHFSR